VPAPGTLCPPGREPGGDCCSSATAIGQ